MSAVLRGKIEQWAKDWSDENSFDPGMEGLGELHAILDQDAILTATPTPTPPLVDMIEAALVAHRGDFHQDDWWIICKCGQQWPVGGKVHSHEAYAAFAAHQARAVLTAISEAGAVEWGVFRITDAPVTRPFDEAKFTTKSGAEVFIKLGFLERVAKTLEPRRRLTTPWERAE